MRRPGLSVYLYVFLQKLNLPQNESSHLNLKGDRNPQRVVGEASGQIGKPMRIYFDPEDMRVVAAFLASGEEIGPLSRLLKYLPAEAAFLRLRSSRCAFHHIVKFQREVHAGSAV